MVRTDTGGWSRCRRQRWLGDFRGGNVHRLVSTGAQTKKRQCQATEQQLSTKSGKRQQETRHLLPAGNSKKRKGKTHTHHQEVKSCANCPLCTRFGRQVSIQGNSAVPLPAAPVPARSQQTKTARPSTGARYSQPPGPELPDTGQPRSGCSGVVHLSAGYRGYPGNPGSRTAHR